MENDDPLRRRVLPFHELNLLLPQSFELGDFSLRLKLAFGLAAYRAVKARTGYELQGTDNVWLHVAEENILHTLFWAACIEYQPCYDCPSGFETAGTFLDGANMPLVLQALIAAFMATMPKIPKTAVN